MLSLLSCYLSGLKQSVKNGNYLSTLIVVTSGVPQGSILAHLLYLLFIKDLHLQCIVSSQYSVHIRKYQKTNSTFFVIKRNSPEFSMSTKFNLYKSMLLSIITYSSWCFYPSIKITHLLESFQKRICEQKFWFRSTRLANLAPSYLDITDISLLTKGLL